MRLTIVDYKGHRRLEAEFELMDKLKFGKIQLAVLRETSARKIKIEYSVEKVKVLQKLTNKICKEKIGSFGK